jgi:hypothetical protein
VHNEVLLSHQARPPYLLASHGCLPGSTVGNWLLILSPARRAGPPFSPLIHVSPISLSVHAHSHLFVCYTYKVLTVMKRWSFKQLFSRHLMLHLCRFLKRGSLLNASLPLLFKKIYRLTLHCCYFFTVAFPIFWPALHYFVNCPFDIVLNYNKFLAITVHGKHFLMYPKLLKTPS